MPTSAARPGPARRPAQAVTSARASQEDDRRQRMRSYLIAMGIRTLSFPAAVWAFVNHHLVLGWILVVLAVLIPSVAVALANAVDHRGESRTSVPLSPVQGLGPAPTAPDDVAGPTTRDDLIVGHVVPGPDEPDDRPRP